MDICSKHEGCHSDTSNEAHNPLGLSVEKHSNNFIVSNDVLVLEVCKRCTDVVIVKNLTRVSPEKLPWFNTCTSGTYSP